MKPNRLWPVLLLATSATSLAASLDVKPIAFTERQLANGLQVLAIENHASPTVSVQVWYHVGSKDDPAGRSGFAHLFEHLMFKSTQNLKPEQFDRLTEDVGGSNNAFTAPDVTAYHEVVPSNHLQTILWAEAERMSNLKIDEPNFKSERAVVQEEYRQRVLASPYGRLFNGIDPAAYQVHPYKRPGIGSIEDLDAASVADVVAFHKTYYRPDNATLVVAGDFEPKQLQAWIDQYFSRIKRPVEAIPQVTVQEPVWASDRHVQLTGPQVPLPAIAIVWQAPQVSNSDAPALKVAAAILSAGDSSRLNQALVYRGQMASQTGFEADLRKGTGLLTAYAMAASGKTLSDIGKVLEEQVKALASKTVSQAELDKVKTTLLTQALVERQTPLGQASALADAAVQLGDAKQFNSALAALQKVTATDVQRVMKRYVASAHKVSVSYTQEPKAQESVKKEAAQ